MTSRAGGDDPYAELGVRRAATDDELRQAWRRLVREHHPDLAPTGDAASAAAERTARINAAYRLLADPVRRAEHDRRARPVAPSYAPPAYVGSVHLGLSGLRSLAVAAAASLTAIAVGGALGLPVLVGAGAIGLPCAGVWFVVSELNGTDGT